MLLGPFAIGGPVEEREDLEKGNICSWFFGNLCLVAKLHNGIQMGT